MTIQESKTKELVENIKKAWKKVISNSVKVHTTPIISCSEEEMFKEELKFATAFLGPCKKVKGRWKTDAQEDSHVLKGLKLTCEAGIIDGNTKFNLKSSVDATKNV